MSLCRYRLYTRTRFVVRLNKSPKSNDANIAESTDGSDSASHANVCLPSGTRGERKSRLDSALHLQIEIAELFTTKSEVPYEPATLEVMSGGPWFPSSPLGYCLGSDL